MSTLAQDGQSDHVSDVADALARASRGLCEAFEQVSRVARLAAERIERAVLIWNMCLRVHYLDRLIPLTPRPMKWVYQFERTMLKAKIDGRHLIDLGF